MNRLMEFYRVMTFRSIRDAQLKRWSAVKDILHCIYFYSVRTRIGSYLLLIFTGVLNKILALATFVVVIQAVIALIMPQKVVAVLHKIGQSRLIDLLSENLDIAAYGSIVAVQITAAVTVLLHHYLWDRLLEDMLSAQLIENGVWGVKDDNFMVEQISLGSQALLRVLIASSYLFVLVLMLGLFSLSLVLLLLPLLIVLVFLQLAAMRNEVDQKVLLSDKKSQWVRAQRRAKEDKSDENLSRYHRERKNFLDVKRHVDYKAVCNTVWLTSLGSVLLLVIVYSITKVPDMDITFLAGYLILFVFAVRGIVSSLREISTNINKILNLRKYRSSIINLLDNIAVNQKKY